MESAPHRYSKFRFSAIHSHKKTCLFMKILLVTDNRYWRESIGSQKRISTLCHHLSDRHQLEILFLGKLSASDRAQLDHNERTFRPQADPLPMDAPLSPAPRSSHWKKLRSLLKQGLVELIRLKTSCGYRNRHLRLFSLQIKEPKLRDFVRPEWESRFRAACQDFAPDAIIIEYVRLAWLLEHCADIIPADCKKIIDTHDVQHLRQGQFHKHGQVHDIDISPNEEARALSFCDAALAIQDKDAKILSQLQPSIEIILAPHPYPITPQVLPEGKIIRFAFFGSSMAPNQDALKRLTTRIWPETHKVLGSNAELLIFGNVGDSQTAPPQSSGIRIEGFVPDLLTAYAQAHIVLNPVAYGGGLKIKSVEALCLGKPLVTTAIGAEGLEAGANTAFIQADSDLDFSAAMIALALDKERRHELSSAALAYAERNFSPRHIFDGLDLFLSK